MLVERVHEGEYACIKCPVNRPSPVNVSFMTAQSYFGSIFSVINQAVSPKEYHQPLYKYITLVTRAQVGQSGGESYMLYNIAGMDNNVTIKVDSNVHFA